MKRLLFLALAVLVAAGCGSSGSKGSAGSQGPIGTLVGIEVSPTGDAQYLGETLALLPGETLDLRAVGVYDDGSRKDITEEALWESQNPEVAEVDSQPGSCGLVRAVGAGDTYISCFLEGVQGTAGIKVQGAGTEGGLRIDVSPRQASIPAGVQQQFRAFVTFPDDSVREVTDEVLWSSSDEGIASIESSGLAVGKSAGQSRITASLDDQESHADLEVTSARLVALEVSPEELSLPVGIKEELKAYGHYSDGSVKDLTNQVAWSTGNALIVTVGNAGETKGRLTPLSPGAATITAADGGFEASAHLTVTGAILVSVEISPREALLPPGLMRRFSATGHFSDGRKLDLTNTARWFSSEPQIAKVSSIAGKHGFVTAVSTGKATIGAEVEERQGTAAVHVTTARPAKLKIIPDGPVLPPGITYPFKVRCLFTDGTIEDVTSYVAWRVADETVAVVERFGEKMGEVSARTPGATQIEASWEELKASTRLDVEPSILEILQNRGFPHSEAWVLEPLTASCEEDLCLERSLLWTTLGDRVVHGQYKLRAMDGPIVIKTRASDQYGATMAYFGGLPDEKILQKGEEIVFTLESGWAHEGAKLQWSIEIDGWSAGFMKTVFFRNE